MPLIENSRPPTFEVRDTDGELRLSIGFDETEDITLQDDAYVLISLVEQKAMLCRDIADAFDRLAKFYEESGA